MVNSELDLRRALKSYANGKDHVHFSFIESHATSAGVPDVAYTICSVNGWLELKFGTCTKAPRLRQSQRLWFKSNTQAGGHPLVLLATPKQFGLIRGELYDQMFEARTTDRWLELCGVLDESLPALLARLTNRNSIPIRGIRA